MFKTSRFCQELEHPASHSLTPIRDYENDYFHKDDNKLPAVDRFPYGKPKGYRESFKASPKFKRPASLVLGDQADLPNKKQFSPLNLSKFSDIVMLGESSKSTSMEGLEEFLHLVRNLYESEISYAELMETSNLVYRKSLRENRSFRNKLIQNDSHEELLLFGNIETISSISRLFASSLESLLSFDKPSQPIDESYWSKLMKSQSMQEKMLENMDIGKAFNLHFLRIKTTYLSYSVTQRKQKDLLEFLQSENPDLYRKWYSSCLKSAQMNKLEFIFERPVMRLKEWTDTLSQLYPLSLKLLSDQFTITLLKALEQFQSFQRDVAIETKEFDNAMYDFSLTPVEIIQSYGGDHEPKKASIVEQQHTQRVSQQSSEKSLLRLMRARRESKSTNGRTSSVFSRSSSRYSGDSTVLASDEVRISQESHEIEWQPDEKDSLTLIDHITKLKKVHRGLIALKGVIGKEDMLSLLDINLRHAKTWELVIQCDADSAKDDGLRGVFDTTMYSAYVDKLQRQREEATLMKVNEIESSVKTPLSDLIELCERVRSRLRDLNTLKKDYMTYLRERTSSTHDIKKDILGKHFEQMQKKILHELPQFIELVHRAIEAIVLNYHRKMLRYLEIAAGGDTFLIRDLESLGKLKRDVGKHYDILETFSSSRYYTKRTVRDEWKFPQDKTASRVLRKLFEL